MESGDIRHYSSFSCRSQGWNLGILGIIALLATGVESGDTRDIRHYSSFSSGMKSGDIFYFVRG